MKQSDALAGFQLLVESCRVTGLFRRFVTVTVRVELSNGRSSPQSKEPGESSKPSGCSIADPLVAIFSDEDSPAPSDEEIAPSMLCVTLAEKATITTVQTVARIMTRIALNSLFMFSLMETARP